mgnify:CR=1 FL=1
MNPEKIKKWIRIIAGWSLFLAICGAFLYGLSYFKVVEEQLKTIDHFDFIVGTIAGFIIFIGLWKLTSWGWKFTIISTALFWIYNIFNISIEYERFTGIATALFLIIDALILVVWGHSPYFPSYFPGNPVNLKSSLDSNFITICTSRALAHLLKM